MEFRTYVNLQEYLAKICYGSISDIRIYAKTDEYFNYNKYLYRQAYATYVHTTPKYICYYQIKY